MISSLVTAASGKHQCTTCDKSYSTSGHLRRHEATHFGRRELNCPLCQAQFSRRYVHWLPLSGRCSKPDRDLARRHVQKCATQGHDVILPVLKRGRKRMSCDQCSSRKLSCNAKMPCMRCRSGGATCTYKRLSLAPSSTSPIEDNVEQSHREANRAKSNARGDFGRISVNFLLNFTDPSGYRPCAAIAAEATDVSAIEAELNHWNPQLHLEDHQLTHDSTSCDLDDDFSIFFSFPSSIHQHKDTDRNFLYNDYPAFTSQESTTLRIRMNELTCQLAAQHDSMLERDRDLQPMFELQLAEAAFSPENVRHFVGEYFHYFHDQLPILHKPTFDIKTVSLPLLLTVVLFGSISSNPSDNSIAIRRFFDVAEAFVFDKLVSWQMLQCPQEACKANDGVELLQAGLLFLILQFNSEDLARRRRIRLQRIPSLIAAVRISGLFRYKRRCLVPGRNSYEWQDFISDEMRVRVAAWTLMIDSTVAVFFNVFPQVIISEMTGDLPCVEDLFRAESALEYERISLQRLPLPPVPVLPELMSTLFFAPVSEHSVQAGKFVTAAHMLILICALQSVVMTSRMNPLASTTFDVILRAVERWKGLWDVVSHDSRSGPMSYKGFERHAAECWWLTRTLLKVAQSGDQSCRYLQPVPSDSAKDLHDFVSRYKDYTG